MTVSITFGIGSNEKIALVGRRVHLDQTMQQTTSYQAKTCYQTRTRTNNLEIYITRTILYQTSLKLVKFVKLVEH